MEYPWFMEVVHAFGEDRVKISKEVPKNGILLGLAKTTEGARRLLWEKMLEKEQNT